MIKAQLLLKVPGREPIPVKTSIPCTLKRLTDDKMIGYSNTDEVALVPEANNKRRVVQAWNGWRKDDYEVVWDGTGAKGLTKSKLPTQKGLLMGDYDGGSATRQIMDHMEMMDIDDVVDPTELSKKKKGKVVKG
jgi:hypothetical protein